MRFTRVGAPFEIPKTLEVALIILDNKDLQPISLSLKRVALQRVTIFDHIYQAIPFAKERLLALLMVDIRSQSLLGLETLKDSKIDNESQNFPVIPVVEVGGQATVLPLLQKYGVTEVVTMPLQTANLLQSIRRTLAGFLPGELENQIRIIRSALLSGQIDNAAGLLEKLSAKRRTLRTELGLSHVSLARNDLHRSRGHLASAKAFDPNNFGVQIAILRQLLQVRAPTQDLAELVSKMMDKLLPVHRAGHILRSFYRAGHYPDGLRISVTFENDFNCDPHLRLWHATLALNCLRLDTALQYLQKFHVHGIQTLESLNMLGVIHKKKHFEAAVKAFREASEISPKDARILFNLGMVCEKMGVTKRAVRAYEQALSLAPGFEKATLRLRRLRPDKAAS